MTDEKVIHVFSILLSYIWYAPFGIVIVPSIPLLGTFALLVWVRPPTQYLVAPAIGIVIASLSVAPLCIFFSQYTVVFIGSWFILFGVLLGFAAYVCALASKSETRDDDVEDDEDKDDESEEDEE